ncbi:HIT domain-containing protein [Streptomyces sp. ODS28]|uniref:HIT family protein n=1 Tax=Streptomyces sp. ODS28 TaxID=3136688 RepID=UPI0031E50983
MNAAPCVFCEIVAGRANAYRVYEDEHAVAFLDTRPLFPGHVLVVPREHAETLVDLPPGEVAPFFARVQRLTGAVQRGMESAGSLVLANNTISQSVPHLHFHVIPRNRKDGLRGFLWPRGRYESAERAEEVAGVVRGALGE